MKQTAFLILEKTLNAYIKLDPYAAHLRQPLHHKIIQFEPRELPFALFLQFTPEKIVVLVHADTPDAIIRGSVFNLARLSQRENKTAAMQELNIQITGDLEVATQFQVFWDSLHIDWTEIIAKVTGDPIAVALNRGANIFKRAIKEVHKTTRHTLGEYLQEELRLVPSREEVTDFMNDVDKLRLDSERVIARIQRLQEKLN